MTMLEEREPFQVGDRVESTEAPGLVGVIRVIVRDAAVVYYSKNDYITVPIDTLEPAE